jgi:hypothetical protein
MELSPASLDLTILQAVQMKSCREQELLELARHAALTRRVLSGDTHMYTTNSITSELLRRDDVPARRIVLKTGPVSEPVR